MWARTPQKYAECTMNTPGSAPRRSADKAQPKRRVPVWLRALIPAALILAWLAAGAIGGPYFGKIGEVSSNDQTSYLPASSESTRVQDLQREFTDSDSIPAIVVYARSGGLTQADRDFADARIQSVKDLRGVSDGVFFGALEKNIGYSGLVKLKEPKLRAGEFSPQFSVKHMHKDMRLASRTAACADFPVLEAVRDALKTAEARGLGDEDFSAVIRLLETD